MRLLRQSHDRRATFLIDKKANSSYVSLPGLATLRPHPLTRNRLEDLIDHYLTSGIGSSVQDGCERLFE